MLLVFGAFLAGTAFGLVCRDSFPYLLVGPIQTSDCQTTDALTSDQTSTLRSRWHTNLVRRIVGSR